MTELVPSTPRKKATRTAAAGGAVLTLGAALVAQAPPAGAAPFTVTNDDDDGAGSLRVAVEAANAAAGADTITFAPGLGPITLTTGEIEITDELTITGPATVSGGGSSRIFYIDNADSVTISGLTLQDGAADDGGAIRSDGTDLTVQQSTITGSEADEGHGGAIAVYGANETGVTITGSTIAGNTADEGGGGVHIYAGEQAGEVPAIVVSGSTFDDNVAGYSGGGLGTRHVYDIRVDTTTFSNNSALGNGEGPGRGGGAYFHAHGDGTVSILSSTISGNDASDQGGGLFFGQPGYADIAHTTIASNDAPYGGGVAFYRTGDSTFDHVLIGDNTASEQYAEVAAWYGDGDPNPIPTRFSLLEGDSTENLIDDVEGNVFGEDPVLAALADNGGPNQTMALTATSPTLNTGDPAFEPPPAEDQRGLPRVQFEVIDMGAYEAQPEDPPPPPPAEPPAAQPTEAAPRFTG